MRALPFLLMLALGFAQAKDTWLSAATPNQRFLVQGRRGEHVQTLTVWASRSLALLEKEIGLPIPFQERRPMVLTLIPELRGARLSQRYAQGILFQEIQISERLEFFPQALADSFARACLSRLMLAQNPIATAAPLPPEWLVQGLSHLLIEGQSAQLLAIGVDLWQQGRLDVPEEWTRRENVPDDGPARAMSALATRWLFREGGPDRLFLWTTLREKGGLDSAWWLEHFPQAHDLRDLHIAWDLWMGGRERALAAENPSLETAMRALAQALAIRPGEFGFAGDLPRHAFLSLEDLIPHLGEPWVRPLLQGWMVRLQPIRFRQSEEFRSTADAYLAAAEALIRADRAKEKGREPHLRAFRDAWQDAHRRYRDLEKQVAIQRSLEALRNE